MNQRERQELHTAEQRRAWFKKIPKALWAAIAGVATLISYVTLRPMLSIDPYASQDPHAPFAEQFYIQNNSLYDLRELQSGCGADDVSMGKLSMKGFSLVNPFDFTGRLSSGARGTVTCKLDMLVAGKPSDYPRLLITIWVKFKTPLNISVCKASKFNGIRTTEGTYIWTYRGSPDCPSGILERSATGTF